MKNRPPRLLEGLLRWAIGSDPAGLSIVGDLREEYAAARTRWPRWRANGWYAVLVVRVCARVRGSRTLELVRGLGGGEVFQRIGQDLRYGLRSLWGSPVFTAVAVVTIAVGIGATTSIYSVVHGVLIQPLPFEEPDRLVDVAVNTGGGGWYGASVPEFLDFERELTTVTGLGGYTTGTRTVGDTLQPRRIAVAFLTASVLPSLGAPPLIGRYLLPEEDEPGASVSVLLSEGHWQREYGADPEVLGRTIAVGNTSAEIVGVMPESFRFPSPQTEMWMAFRMDRENPAPRANHFVNMVGRLSPDGSVERARAEVAALATRSIEMYPENYSERGFRTRVISLRDSVVGEAETAISVAFAAVLLVLLIASVNVINLLLSRGELRHREVAIRNAMGAGRGRITAQLLVENGLLAVIGGALGIGLGWVGMQVLLAAAPDGAPRLEDVSLSPDVLAFSAFLIVACGLACGLWPAIHATRVSLRSELGERAGRGRGRRGQLVRRVLVASQVALAAALALGAGVMIRSLDNLYDVDRGFAGDGVLTFRLDLPGGRYGDSESIVAFYQGLIAELEQQPGVTGAAAASRLPLYNTYAQWSLALDGVPKPGIGSAPDGYAQVATPGYFEIMGIRPTRGRLFGEEDRAESPPVAVVNETMAQTLWPGQEPLGQRFRMWSDGWPFMEVIGVIADVKELQIDQPAQPRFYVPHTQSGVSAYQTPGGMYITLGTTGDPADALPTALRVLAGLDPTIPMSRVQTMTDVIATSLGAQRFAELLLKIFGGVAVLLACVGVYGVMAVSVAQRTREIGLRKALGARSSTVLSQVLRDSAVLTVVGGAVGVATGIVGTSFMETLLFDVRGSDPLTLTAVMVVIGGTAIVAAAVPALRASRVDPMVALRGD